MVWRPLATVVIPPAAVPRPAPPVATLPTQLAAEMPMSLPDTLIRPELSDESSAKFVWSWSTSNSLLRWDELPRASDGRSLPSPAAASGLTASRLAAIRAATMEAFFNTVFLLLLMGDDCGRLDLRSTSDTGSVPTNANLAAPGSHSRCSTE